MSAFEISYLSFKVSFGASFIFDVKFFYASRLTAIGALEKIDQYVKNVYKLPKYI